MEKHGGRVDRNVPQCIRPEVNVGLLKLIVVGFLGFSDVLIQLSYLFLFLSVCL